MLRKIFSIFVFFCLISLLNTRLTHASVNISNPCGTLTPSLITDYHGQAMEFAITSNGLYLDQTKTYKIQFHHPSQVVDARGPLLDADDDWGSMQFNAKKNQFIFTRKADQSLYAPDENSFIRVKNANDGSVVCRQAITILDSYKVSSNACTIILNPADPRPSVNQLFTIDNLFVRPGGAQRYIAVFNKDREGDPFVPEKSQCISDSNTGSGYDLGSLTGNWEIRVQENCVSGNVTSILCNVEFSSTNAGGTVKSGNPCLICNDLGENKFGWDPIKGTCVNLKDPTQTQAPGYTTCSANSTCNTAHIASNACLLLGSGLDDSSQATQDAPCPNDPGPNGASNIIMKDGVKVGCKAIPSGLGISIPTDFGKFVTALLGVVLSISGGIAILLIIISGYRLMVSQGNPEKIQAAKDELTAAIVGFLFIIFSLVILQVIGFDILHLPGFGS